MIALSMKEIEKYYAANKVLSSITFEINEGEKVAIVGRNGCGKTTLFKLIVGSEKYEKGMLALKKGIKLGYLEQVPAAFQGISVYSVLLGGVEEVTKLRAKMSELEKQMSHEKDEKLLEELVVRYGRLTAQYEGMDGYSVESRVDMVTTGLQISRSMYDMDFENLSGGEKTAIALAYRLALNQVINNLVSTIKTKDLIILDEPTDGFSEEQLDRLKVVLDELQIKQIIIVSHEAKVEGFVDNVIRIEKKNHVSKVFR